MGGDDVEVVATVVLVEEVGGIVGALEGVDLLVYELALLGGGIDADHGGVDFVACLDDFLYEVVDGYLDVCLG